MAQNPSGGIGKSMSQTVAEVGRLVPELAMRARELGIKGWLSGPAQVLSISSGDDTERIRLFQSVTELLIHYSNEKPLLVLFDDVVWADAASLQLLQYVCRRIRDQRIMLVAAYRDVELAEEHPLLRMLVDLNRDRISRGIKLTRFTDDYVAEVISNYLGGGSSAPEFTRLIHSRTGGNPLFVEEILRSLSEDSRIYKSPDGWTVREIGGLEIPLTVKALIKQRVTRLGGNALQVLTNASAIGMEFGYEILKRTTGQTEEALIVELERASKAGIVKEKGSGNEIHFLFTDEQVRDFLYGELSIIRERKTHAKIAEALEQTYGKSKSQHVEELASHYVQGAVITKAVEYSVMAGGRAGEVYAYAEAKKHYVNALDLLDQNSLEDRLKILARLGDFSRFADTYDECMKYYAEAVGIASQLKDSQTLGRLYARMGTVTWYETVLVQKALEYFKEGLKGLETDPDSHEKAALYQEMARLLIVTGETESGLSLCQQAVRIAERLNSKEVLAHSYQTLALGLHVDPLGKPRIFAQLHESEKIAVSPGFEEVLCRGYDNLAMAYSIIKGDYQKAEEYEVKALASARKVGFRNYETYAEGGLALYAYFPLGEWDKALEAANHSVEMASETSILNASKSHVVIGLVNLFRGNTARAEEHLKTAYSLAERSRLIERVYPSLWALGMLYLEMGDLERAEEKFLMGLESASRWGWSSPALEVLTELVRVNCLKKELEKALEFHRRMTNEAKRLDEKWGYAYESWAKGLLEAAREDWDQAAVSFEKSGELWKELGHRYNYSQTILDSDAVLAGVGGQTRKGSEEAKKILTKLGATPSLSRMKIS